MLQDSPSLISTKPSATPGADQTATSGRAQLRVVVLGANLWAIAVLWPMLGARSTGAGELGLGLLCPLPLALGAALGGPTRWSWLRSGLWLVAYPTALLGAIAARPEALNQQLYHLPALLLLWLSLCAYFAGASAACGERSPELLATHAPLGNELSETRPNERRLQRAFIALCLGGAAALCLVAPSWGGLPALEQAWGDAASPGGVLTAVVGAALGVTTLAVYLSSGLRRSQEPNPHTDRGLRATWFLFLALLGAVTYFVVQP